MNSLCKNISKRILSVIIVLVMVMQLFVITDVSAEETPNVGVFANKIETLDEAPIKWQQIYHEDFSSLNPHDPGDEWSFEPSDSDGTSYTDINCSDGWLNISYEKSERHFITVLNPKIYGDTYAIEMKGKWFSYNKGQWGCPIGIAFPVNNESWLDFMFYGEGIGLFTPNEGRDGVGYAWYGSYQADNAKIWGKDQDAWMRIEVINNDPTTYIKFKETDPWIVVEESDYGKNLRIPEDWNRKVRIQVEGSSAIDDFAIYKPIPVEAALSAELNSVDLLFGEPMDPGTFTNDGFKLIGPDNNVSFTAASSGDPKKVSLILSEPLEYGSGYKVEIAESVHTSGGSPISDPKNRIARFNTPVMPPDKWQVQFADEFSSGANSWELPVDNQVNLKGETLNFTGGKHIVKLQNHPVGNTFSVEFKAKRGGEREEDSFAGIAFPMQDRTLAILLGESAVYYSDDSSATPVVTSAGAIDMNGKEYASYPEGFTFPEDTDIWVRIVVENNDPTIYIKASENGEWAKVTETASGADIRVPAGDIYLEADGAASFDNFILKSPGSDNVSALLTPPANIYDDIRLKFTGAINFDTYKNNIKLIDLVSGQEAAYTPIANMNSYSLIPNAPLETNTEYKVEIGDSLKTLLCKSLEGTREFTFTTEKSEEEQWPLLFDEQFDSFSMWKPNPGYTVKDGLCTMYDNGNHADWVFAMSELGNVDLKGNYMVDFRMRVDGDNKDSVVNSYSGIMLGNKDSSLDNFSVLLDSSGIYYLPSYGSYISLERLADYPEGVSLKSSEWINVRVKVKDSVPEIFVKTDEMRNYKKCNTTSSFGIKVPDGSLRIRSQVTTTRYDSLKIYAAPDSGAVVKEAVIDEVSLDITEKTLYQGESLYIKANIKAPQPYGYRAVWTAEPSDVISISGCSPDKRTITALKPGKAKLILKVGNKTVENNITVNEKYQSQKKYATFSASETGKAIPKDIYGVHNELAWNIGRHKDFAPQEFIDLTSQLKFQTIRGPGGTDANYLIQAKGDVINYRFPDLLKKYYDSTNSPVDNAGVRDGYPALTYENVFKLTNAIDTAYVYDANIISQTPEDIVEIIRNIKKHYTGDIRIEMGNETYDYWYPYKTVKDYIARCKEVNAAIKKEFPDVKTGIVILSSDLDKRIKADPNNTTPDPDVNFEDTALGHYGPWNEKIAKNPDCYDAVIPHIYVNLENPRDMTQSELMRYLYAYNADVYDGLLSQSKQQFSGKEFWVTEWGMIPYMVLWEKDEGERARLQISKSPGFAISYFERMLDMIKSDVVTISAYHSLNDDQGFGIFQMNMNNPQNSYLLPNFYTFKEIGDILDKYKFSYDISPVKCDYTFEKMRFSRVKEPVKVNDAAAWGFGDSSGMKLAVLANRTRDNMNISLDGFKIKKVWSYGGEDVIFPDYLNNTNSSWYDPVANFQLPDTSIGEFAEQVNVAPYSMMIVEVAAVNVNEKPPVDVPGTTTPSTPTQTPKPVIEAPKVEKGTDGTTTVKSIAKQPATVSGNSAIATVTAEDANKLISDTKKAIEAAIANGAKAESIEPVIEIKSIVEKDAAITKSEIGLPKAAIEKIAKIENAGLKLSTQIAEIVFDTKAMEAIGKKAANDVKFVAEVLTTDKVLGQISADKKDEVKTAISDRPVYDFKVFSANGNISDLEGGKAVITIPYTLKAGEKAENVVIYHVDASGKLQVVNSRYNEAAKCVEMKLSHFSTYVVGYNAVAFRDVNANAWYSKAVAFVSARNIASGVGNDKFAPDMAITRGQFIKMLCDAYGLKNNGTGTGNFADAGDTWYTEALLIAKQQGISAGVGNNQFAPEKEITRQEMFTLLYNALNKLGQLPTGNGKKLDQYNDHTKVTGWAVEAMNYLTQNGIAAGANGNINPQATATRAEMVQLLYNLLR